MLLSHLELPQRSSSIVCNKRNADRSVLLKEYAFDPSAEFFGKIWQAFKKVRLNFQLAVFFRLNFG